MRQLRHIVLGVVVLAAVLTACGRRGPLERAPNAPPPPPPAQDGFILDRLIR